ncbi:MAG TPA: PIN domain-containing protein [Bryobacteraceae bacterium]|jgi:predicted nucleic acid-binding protein
MTGTSLVVLDACVLANFSLCDTLLRLAEPPRLYEPKWSDEIIRETTRTLESKLGWPSSLATYLEAELRAHFGEAWISGYEPLIPRMTNDEKDRHVLAAAIHCQAPIIVTFNLRHFRSGHLERWGIRALHPQSFLIEIFRQEEMVVMTKLQQQAADRGRNLRQLLEILNATAPDFVAAVSSAISG